MRKIIFAIVCTVIFTMSMSAQTVDDLFKEFRDKENVECMEIPKAMMSMASGMVNKEKGNDLIKKIDHIRVLSIENNDAVCKKFKARAANLNKKGYETMVNSNEDNEKTLILVKTKGDNITEMVILSLEPSECSLVQLKGKFNSNDMKGLLTSFK
ncbi:MAG: DUF4252 domain-containing protein [Prevotella sp.]|nr:DUF4252 domain-containing protein [Prevotella sp.]